MKLDNPWKRLPRKAPFFLPEDRSAIDAFNGSASDRYRIRGDTLPVPYLGLPDAPILLLNLNPGYTAEDAAGTGQCAFSAPSENASFTKPKDSPPASTSSIPGVRASMLISARGLAGGGASSVGYARPSEMSC